MTFKDLTETIAEKEGLKEPVSIAQIKEITRLVLIEIANTPYSELVRLLSKYEVKE